MLSTIIAPTATINVSGLDTEPDLAVSELISDKSHLASTTRAHQQLDEPDFDLTEIINGQTYMAPAPSNRHQMICSAIVAHIYGQVNFNRVLFAPKDVLINPSNRVQPDIMIYESKESILNNVLPILVIEILSPSSLLHDRVTKFQLYESAAIAEYWLVDPETDSIEIYNLVDGQYQLHTRVIDQGEVTSVAISALRFMVEGIFN